jgi:DNA repair protein RadA/Sms
MKKKGIAAKMVFRCSNCGHEEAKWLGRCPECGEWNTLVESAVSGLGRASPGLGLKGSGPQSLPLALVDPEEGSRISSGVPELDRVLGGGIMKRSAVLVGGEPGVGKSTLLLQMADRALTKGRVLYVSAEESAGQVRMRADRLGLLKKNAGNNIEITCATCLEDIEGVIEALKPLIIIIDSIQTIHSDEIGPAPGTVNQMKYCAWELISWVKEHDAALFLAAHVTKDGIISGPKTLEHMVDAVLYFDAASGGINEAESRFLRAVKNRFGSVDEIGIFTMGETGLSGVTDPGRLFLTSRGDAPYSQAELPPGVAVAAVLEGSRALLVEIQALSVEAKGAVARVFSERIDQARVARVAATLEKHLKLRMSTHDLYVNVAGGIRIAEVGVELPLAAAIYSARSGLSLPPGLALAGELSLAGELRPVRRLSGRIKAADALGFNRFVGPPDEDARVLASSGLHFKSAGGLKEAAQIIFN